MRHCDTGWLVLLLLLASTPVQALDGVLDWAHKVELGLPVSGVIAEVNAGAGQQFKKGDVLLRLESAPFTAAVQQAEAALLRAQLQYRKAKRDDTQSRELYERQVLSTTQLEDAAMALQEAAAAVKDAKGRLQSAQYKLDKSVMTAPFDAVILNVKAVPGQTVINRLQSQPLVTLASRTRYVARAEVAAGTAVSVGQPAWVTVEAVPIKGQVRSVTPANNVLQLEIVFDAPGLMRPGAGVELKLEPGGA